MHLEKHTLAFASHERALEGVNAINKVFCENLNLCLSASCGCELGKGDNICNSLKVESKYRPIFINEGPEWTLVYVVDDNAVTVYVHYYGFKIDMESFNLTKALNDIQFKEAAYGAVNR